MDLIHDRVQLNTSTKTYWSNWMEFINKNQKAQHPAENHQPNRLMTARIRIILVYLLSENEASKSTDTQSRLF